MNQASIKPGAVQGDSQSPGEHSRERPVGSVIGGARAMHYVS
jgi:hypothetical protein